MRLTVTFEVSGKVSPGSDLSVREVLQAAIPNGAFAINTFLESEGHTLKLSVVEAEGVAV